MSRDPLGFDPPAVIQQIHESRTQKAIEAYRAGILLPDVSVARHDQPAVVKGVVGDDGKAITLEDRQRIAAQRKAFDPKLAFAPELSNDNQGYDKDLADRKVEPLGASGQKIIDANPMIRLAPVRNELEPTPSYETVIQPIPESKP